MRTSESSPHHHAEDPAARPVTESDLFERERFWPYQVSLTKAWKPAEARETLSAGLMGVLIRLESSRTARIDFGRDGLHEVPISATNLVERSNRVRTGEIEKMAPNLALAIGPRLIDSAAESPRAVRFEDVIGYRGFLSVFADPNAEIFGALAAELAPLRERPGLLTILFPQAFQSDPEIREKLRSLKWPVPFVLDHLSEPYTRSLLAEGTPLPAFLLQTNEGRVLYASGWRQGVAADLAAAADAELGPAPPLERHTHAFPASRNLHASLTRLSPARP